MDSSKQPPQTDDKDILEQAIVALESRRANLGNEVVDSVVDALREKIATGGNHEKTIREPQRRKIVTILFADVSGFTAMSETMDHEIVNDVINSLWSRVDKAILDHGGRIDKHIGDAIMALYGTPTAHENDPERAIRSALQIQSEIQDWKSQLSEAMPSYQNQIQNIKLRIGINTGLALLGTVGTVGEFTALGDTVKVANQLESAAPKGGILISHDAYQHTQDVFEVTTLEPIKVKGKDEAIQVYTVDGIKEHPATNVTDKQQDAGILNTDIRHEIKHAITVLNTQRSQIGNANTDVALNALHEKLQGRQVVDVPQQRKLVAVLFADISGFTAMFETMDEDTVNDVVDSLWSRVDTAIQAHGGRVDKHIFDVVMALFGIPTAREDDPERAIRAALQVKSEVLEWKREKAEQFPDHKSQIENIQLRIGVNTGPALLGTVGTVGEFTAIGDTVNLAQRLEANAPKGEVMISHETHQLVRGVFEVIALDPIMVKGKREPIQVYTVNGVKPRSFRDTTRGLEGVETRTIGREAEFEQMKTAFKVVEDYKKTGLITLVAEAGIGKSRLLFEFGKYIESLEQPILLLKGRAAQENARIPYSLLRGIFSSAFGIQENDRASIARSKLEQGISSFTGNHENAAVYAHFIGHLIGFDYSSSPYLKGVLSDAQQIRSLAFQYGAQFFANSSRQKTIVVFLEDIHWADADSLDFFDALMNKQPDLPLLIVALTRATLFEQRQDWGTAPVQTLNLKLSPLSETDTRRLIAEILRKAPQVPSVIVDMIVQKAEGSPFYVEELIKVLIEEGVIVRGEEQWSIQLDRLSKLKIPTTLTGLLQARLDSLESDARETLQQASVVGRVFWTDVIEHMRNPEYNLALETTPITERLGSLRTKELIYRYEESASAGGSEFIFKNQILHDVTYESVLLRFRPIYHAQAADGLVEVGGERANEYAGRVGEHYEKAEEWLKAAEWFTRAGKQAQNTYSSDTAVSNYEKALNFYTQYGGPEYAKQKLEVHRHLSEVLNWQARYDEAIENAKLMLQFAEENKDVVAQVRALLSMGFSQTYQGDHLSSLDNAMRAKSLALSVDEKGLLARALLMEGQARWRLGETQAALTLDEQALAIFTELNSENDMAIAMNLLGGAHYTSGKFDKAEEYWEKALNIFQELGNRMQGMNLSSNLGAIAEARGDYETAFQRFDSALTISQEIGYRDGQILYLTNRGGAQVALKNYQAADTDLRQAIATIGTAGSWVLSSAFNLRAQALLGMGNTDEAFYSARQALVLAEEDKTPEDIGMAWRTLGMISGRSNVKLSISDWETRQENDYDAEACFNKSIQILTEAEIESEIARTLREWARYEFQHRNREMGEQKWKEARDIFEKLGAHMEVERMKDFPA